MATYELSTHGYDSENLEKLFLGRRIQRVSYEQDGSVRYHLDNGIKLRLAPNQGCSCGAGEFIVTDYSSFDHVITRVELLDDGADSYNPTRIATLELFVYGEGLSEAIGSVKGSQGNGYYGRGFKIQVLGEL